MLMTETASSGRLDESRIRQAVCQHLAQVSVTGRRVLAIIPDHTRSGPTGLMFRAIAEALRGRARQVDFLIALGTHPPMDDAKIGELLGISARERAAKYPEVRVFNHCWDDPNQFQQVGVLSRQQVESLSQGRLSIEVPVRVNRLVFDYDHVMICGPVFPHEVVGFSGGHKYLFPGIAAPEVINFTHWLGALMTNPVINGTPETPVRAAIEAAADLVRVERSALCYVVDYDGVVGLFGGEVREAWRAAAALSARTHIVRVDRSYHTVLSCAPAMYDDIWTAGKCMYKLEPVVADGGTLIIYAPHITEVSYSHGRVLDEVGYHVRDYFVKQWSKFREYPWGVLAHSTHVKGIGTFENGHESPRVYVVLATQIPRSRCEQINLGYLDPATIDPASYAGRESEGVLRVPHAGEMLYQIERGHRGALPG